MLLLYHRYIFSNIKQLCIILFMDEEEKINQKEPVCPRCGLRSYDSTCPNCGTPIVDNQDDEEEEYDWREKRR